VSVSLPEGYFEGELVTITIVECRTRILDALRRYSIQNEKHLKLTVAGKTIESATKFLKKALKLNLFDASALAGAIQQEFRAQSGCDFRKNLTDLFGFSICF
jgi:hypothetical protein